MHVLIGDDNQVVVYNENSAQELDEDRPQKSLSTWFKELFKRKSNGADAEYLAGLDEPENFVPIAQHYNPDRNLIYDEVKSSRESNLTVAVEQVSIFLTHDGTVITFFQVLRYYWEGLF
jgi:Mg2+ and Co2+ transporter CorA